MDWLKRIFRGQKVQETTDQPQSNIPPYDPLLETEIEYRQRWISVRIIYFTMFLMSLGFSIILTGIWPYLDKVNSVLKLFFLKSKS